MSREYYRQKLREWQDDNREHYNEYMRKYRKENRQRVTEIERKSVNKRVLREIKEAL